jgi:hypothetical protein
VTRLAYFEWSAPDDAEYDDPEAWAQANPALGIRISPDFIRTEMGALEAEDFARERLGIFPEDIDATEAAIDEDDWEACRDPSTTLTGPMVLVFEVTSDRKGAVIASVGPSSLGGTHVEIVENRQRTGWVVQRLLELQRKHHPDAIICNPSGPAGGLLADCEREGLTITEIKGADYTQACEAAYDDITEHRWRHGGQADLTAAVTGAAWRAQGDARVFDRLGLLDIAPLIAVTLGAWSIRPKPKKKRAAFL